MSLSVRIRLARAGAKKKPFYRVVVADQRAPRDGKFIEIVGRYNPRPDPSLIELDIERINEWIDKGAQPTETVTKLMGIAESPDANAPETEKDKRVSKKQQAKAAAESDAEATEAEPPADAGAPADAVETTDVPAEATEDAAEEPSDDDVTADAESDDSADEPPGDADASDGAEDAAVE